jgi:hypothetical protein
VIAYIPHGNFRRKDYLASGDPDKLITGAEIAEEFAAVAAAINSHTPGTYTVATAFRPKDFLATGEALKIVSGIEIDAEFDAIATGITALGGSYTKTYDFTDLHNTDAEILGLHFAIEFAAISTAIETIRATSGGFFIVTEAAEFDYITTESDDDQLITEGSAS